MPNFKRYRVPGAAYFFTAVVHERRPILTTELGRSCLREAMDALRARCPFELFAIVLLPDHLHTVWILPPGDADYSVRWAKLKEGFTRRFLNRGGAEGQRSSNRVRHRERAVWQHRFWEHTVRNDEDLERCVSYIHWNPVKHGMVDRVCDYPWSSFSRFVESGDYDPDWGSEVKELNVPGAEWE